MSQIQFCTLTSASTTSNAVRIDLSRFRNGAGLLCNVSSGATAAYTVQISADGSNWNSHDVLIDQIGNSNGNLAFPVAFIRLSGTVSNGSVVLGIIQAS